MLVSENVPKELLEDMWATIESKKTWQGVLENRAKNGSSYFVNASITPILNNRGEIVEYISIREDITDLKKLQFEELNSCVDKALNINLNKIVNMIPISTTIIDENSNIKASNELFKNSFKAKNSDKLDDFFIKKDGYIYSDNVFDWKDVVINSDDPEKVLVDVYGDEKEFMINIKKIESKDFYTVCFQPAEEL